VPISSFPFLTTTPIRAPVSKHSKPTAARFFTQPSIKEPYEGLMPEYCLRQPKYEQDYQQDNYGYCQQVAEREPRATVTTHKLSFPWLAVPVGPLRKQPRYESMRSCSTQLTLYLGLYGKLFCYILHKMHLLPWLVIMPAGDGASRATEIKEFRHE
jgi:hypothetical protein